MTPEMEPMKRCASCGKERRVHEGLACADGGAFKPVTIQWAGFQAEQMAAAEAIYDRRPNIDRMTGLPVPFEDAMTQTRDRCIKQASVEKWTGRAALNQQGPDHG